MRAAFVAILLVFVPLLSSADPAPFDLAGPRLHVEVTRAGTTLPVTEVPDLATGDRLRMRPDLPPGQAARYVMVAAFLRGATNPPPDAWFASCEAWTRRCVEEGLEVTVPDGAQQVLVFFAPDTSAGVRTLRKTVQGRPGAFVRAAQELGQAALDRARLERYLSTVRELGADDPAALKDGAPRLARSLGIKVDEKCLDRLPALQAPCLMRGQEALIMTDSGDPSLVATLTSGPASDLAMQAGNTAALDHGAFIPYIGSLLDIARLLDSFHTAHFQYIPALTAQRGDELALLLNTPPSFHEPQSVLVAALPPVEPAHPPALHAVEPDRTYCAARAPLVLPVEGTPVAFATGYAHDLALTATRGDGAPARVPLHPDARAGGLVADAATLGPAIDPRQPAVVTGRWGFDGFTGPRFRLVNPMPDGWALGAGEDATLVVGRPNAVHLHSPAVPCVANVRAEAQDGRPLPLEWSAEAPDRLALRIDLTGASPGRIVVSIDQYGVAVPSTLSSVAFADPGHLGAFALHAGDTDGVLTGSRLDLVDRLTVGGSTFVPEELTSQDREDQLRLRTDAGADVTVLAAGATAKGTVRLKDGRSFPVEVRISAPRPRATLLAKSVEPAGDAGSVQLEFGAPDEVRPDAALTFSLRAELPASFAHDLAVEVASADESATATLTLANGGVKLADARVAVATLVPGTALGAAAFGPLKFRLVEHGTAGDWQKLAVLVRVPRDLAVDCPTTPGADCELGGRDLFLLDAVGASPTLGHARRVPDGYTGARLAVPRPDDDRLFFRLRDAPQFTNVLHVPRPPAPQDPGHESPNAAAPPPPPPTRP